jgi:hypothetical protein
MTFIRYSQCRMDLVQAFLKKWWVESDFKAPNHPLSLWFKLRTAHDTFLEWPSSGTLNVVWLGSQCQDARRCQKGACFVILWVVYTCQSMFDSSRFWRSCLGTLVYLLRKRFKLFAFPNFQLWAYLMKVIPETRTWWRLFQKHVPDEGYSKHLNMLKSFSLRFFMKPPTYILQT